MIGKGGLGWTYNVVHTHWTSLNPLHVFAVSPFSSEARPASFGQLVVRPDSGDPEETCVAISGPLVSTGQQGVGHAGTWWDTLNQISPILFKLRLLSWRSSWSNLLMRWRRQSLEPRSRDAAKNDKHGGGKRVLGVVRGIAYNLPLFCHLLLIFKTLSWRVLLLTTARFFAAKDWTQTASALHPGDPGRWCWAPYIRRQRVSFRNWKMFLLMFIMVVSGFHVRTCKVDYQSIPKILQRFKDIGFEWFWMVLRTWFCFAIASITFCFFDLLWFLCVSGRS